MRESLHRRLLLSSTIHLLDESSDGVARICMRNLMEGQAFRRMLTEAVLPAALGRTPAGADIAVDLAGMPNLLIGGTLGSGKSACIHAIITSLLCAQGAETVQMILLDLRGTELTAYNGIPHLLAPAIVDPERVVGTLMWITREMERRYRRFAEVEAHNIEDFNGKVISSGQEAIPRIVVFVDELADLMMTASSDVERYLCGIAQKSRDVGVHLVISTARPDRGVVTRAMDALFPARICFALPTSTESRAILGQDGAEWLPSPGELLLRTPDFRRPTRLRGCLISRNETTRLTDTLRRESVSLKGEGKPVDEFVERVLPTLREMQEPEPLSSADEGLLLQAVELVKQEGQATATLLQRAFRIGYARASRIIAAMEERGIVGPDEGGGDGRPVLLAGTHRQTVREEQPKIKPRFATLGMTPTQRGERSGSTRASLLDLARSAIEEGDRPLGGRLLTHVLHTNEHCEMAWLWVSAITEDAEIERECLERVLMINPTNEVARRHLDQLASVEKTAADNPSQSLAEAVLLTGLQSFVGQRLIVTDLSRRIAQAQQRGDPLNHLLLCGPDETGKSTLAQSIAEEMEVGCRQIDAKTIGKTGDLAEILTSLHKGDVLCILELGTLATPVGELLGATLQDWAINVVIGEGTSERSIRLPLPQFTVIGTSSNPSQIDRKLRRWFIAYDFAPYTDSELADIIALLAPQAGLKVDSGAASLLAAHCGGLPGYAAFLLDRLAGFCRARDIATVTDSAAHEALLHFGYVGRPELSVDLAQRLRMMDGAEFERFVASLFQDMGYEVEVTAQTGDHGIDLVITRGEEQIAIQCKAWAGSVGEPVVRDFYGSLIHSGARLGCIIATASFTAEAHAFASGKPVKLISLDELVALATRQRSQG